MTAKFMRFAVFLNDFFSFSPSSSLKLLNEEKKVFNKKFSCKQEDNKFPSKKKIELITPVK